jgi:nitrate/nitrite transport system permease protein
MVVSAVYVTQDGMFSRSFLTSAITVTLCSLWPTLINTSLGVASIDRDLISVSRVLKLTTWTKITRLVLPSALPLIFTGLRLSLGVGWMVLIAAEMLAQNPGLGKFVWDEFQNGSSTSLAKIMVAVFTIGIIGFLLDRLMYAAQSLFTFSDNR